MEGWDTERIGEACEVINGGTPKTKVDEYWGEGHAWVTPAEMGGRESPFMESTKRTLSDDGLASCSASLLPINSVILSSRAPIGHLVINEVEMATNQGCKGLVPSERLCTKFLYYFLFANVELLNSLGTGATFKELSATKLREVPIPLPPLPEQERIVAILDEAFAAIETATAHTEKNLANARELESQVLDLVVTGALSSNFTTETSAKELLNDVERTVDEAVQRKTYRRPRVSSDSQIPVPTFRIPLNWEWAELHSLTVGISDGVHKKPTYVDRGVPFIAIENLTRGPGISFEPVRHITMSDHEEYIKRTHPERGDILITKDGTIGVVRLIETDIEFSIFVSVALVKPASKTMSEYLSLALKAPKIQNQIIPKGAALKHLYLRDLRQLWIPVPPVEEQDHIVGKHRPLNQYIKDLSALSEKRLVALSNLKQSLLHKAFTGELTSDNITADRTLSEAGL